jgi:Uma2 family endonuclease
MSTIAQPPRPTPRRVPPLQNGDRLTRAEFERRFDATPGLKRAELIEGVVYMPPAVSHDWHSAPHFDLIGWLVSYRAAAPGVRGGDNGSIRLDLDNMPQPDAYLIVLPSHGGQVKISGDGYVEGAPEFVAEVAASSASYDLHDKLKVYRRNGVREYVVWRVYDGAIDWFMLRDDRYEPAVPGEDGIFRSEVLPGLWLDAAALMRGDMAAVLRAAQRGLATPEHAAFAAELQRRAAGGR